MRYKVTKRQFNILVNNLELIGNRGLSLKMDGRTAKEAIEENSNDKSYLVKFSMNGYRSKIKVYATNISRARQISAKLLPMAKIFNVIEIRRGNPC